MEVEHAKVNRLAHPSQISKARLMRIKAKDETRDIAPTRERPALTNGKEIAAPLQRWNCKVVDSDSSKMAKRHGSTNLKRKRRE